MHIRYMPSLKQKKNLLHLVPHVQQQTNYTCGSASIASILHFYNDCVKEKEIARDTKANFKDGTTAGNIARYMRKRGIQAEIKQNTTLAQICQSIKQDRPVFVLYQKQPNLDELGWKDGHWSVVVGISNKHLTLIDPSGSKQRTKMTLDNFQVRWYDLNGKKPTYKLAIFIKPNKKMIGGGNYCKK